LLGLLPEACLVGRSGRLRLGKPEAVKYPALGQRRRGATLAKLARASAVAIATIAAICFASRDANALSYSDILGNWCSATARLEFSRTAMGVFLFSSKSHSTTPVTRYEFGSTVTVYWMKDGKETSSDFSEFSADGRTMLLQPAEDVPRREYRRC
jgi:hypothetical protein